MMNNTPIIFLKRTVFSFTGLLIFIAVNVLLIFIPLFNNTAVADDEKKLVYLDVGKNLENETIYDALEELPGILNKNYIIRIHDDKQEVNRTINFSEIKTNGHSITLTGIERKNPVLEIKCHRGIYINIDNLHIKNLIINGSKDFSIGISGLRNSVTVSECVIKNAQRKGISASYLPKNSKVIFKNNILFHCETGIYINESHGIQIINNNFAYNHIGLNCGSGARFNTVRNNIFYYNRFQLSIDKINRKTTDCDYNLYFFKKEKFKPKSQFKSQNTHIVGIKNWQVMTGWDKNSITKDPLFVDPGKELFQLKSKKGYFFNNKWLIADKTSQAIDAGDPKSDYSLEPKPNGKRINLGRYGGTIHASKSYYK